MFGIINTSDKYYDKNTQLDELCISNKECIICWLPSSKDNPVKCMKNYPFYISNCKCNAFFHDSCLEKWFNTQSSCPICRSNISIQHIQNSEYCIEITAYFIILVNNTFYIFKMLSFFSTINLFFILFYNIIFFDFNLIDYPDEYAENF